MGVASRQGCVMNDMLFEYQNSIYPFYLKTGNACQFFAPFARQFCRGVGLDIGGGDWPFDGAICVDMKGGGDAMALPDGEYDYIVSSHCLEHLINPVAALEHWKTRLKPGAPLLLYLPHPDQKYWRPQFNRKHLHMWWPKDMAQLVSDLGFVDVIHSERDLYWAFAVVGFKPTSAPVHGDIGLE